MTERTLTGVRATFSASHYSPEGEDHGHDYVVWAYFPAGSDARDLMAKLKANLASLDHQRLPRTMQWDNQIAPYIGKALGAVRVEVARPIIGIKAVWESGE